MHQNGAKTPLADNLLRSRERMLPAGAKTLLLDTRLLLSFRCGCDCDVICVKAPELCDDWMLLLLAPPPPRRAPVAAPLAAAGELLLLVGWRGFVPVATKSSDSRPVIKPHNHD